MDWGGGLFYVICTFIAKTLFVMLLNFNMLCYVTLCYVTLCYVMPHSGYYQIPSNVCRLMTIVCASHKNLSKSMCHMLCADNIMHAHYFKQVFATQRSVLCYNSARITVLWSVAITLYKVRMWIWIFTLPIRWLCSAQCYLKIQVLKLNTFIY